MAVAGQSLYPFPAVRTVAGLQKPFTSSVVAIAFFLPTDLTIDGRVFFFAVLGAISIFKRIQ